MPNSPRAEASRRAKGFTLIEVLVVLVIVGVVTATLMLAAGGSGSRELENAAQRSRGLIALACERAVLTGRDLGFAPTRAGLRFGYFQAEGWRPLGDEGSDELRAGPWGAGVEANAEREGEAMELPEGAPSEADFACFSSGELTPFRFDFRRADVAEVWTLQGALDGSLTLTARDDDAP
jgi:general secretion pathway protein H